jgi:signal transduction histidine kinase
MSQAARLLKDQKFLIPDNSPVPNRRILVVDDEPEIAKGISRILSPKENKVVELKSSRSRKAQTDEFSRKPFEVVVVNDPEAALKAVEESLRSGRPFAMGFFDVVLGASIDGIELVRQVFALDPHMYAVFVTAYQDRSVDAISSYLGEEQQERWDYINKPFSEGEILQKARNVTGLWDLNRLKNWQQERLSEAHQLLMASEKQTAIAAVGRSVAHEFGNLLTHIIGHAEIAKMSEDVQDIKSSIDVILKAGQTAATVLKNFRNLNENQERDLELRLTPVLKVVDEALELMEFRFRRHGIKVSKVGGETLSAQLNKSSLVQVFANIFINAIHAMPKGGHLEIQLSEQAESCQIQIKDSGPGIPPEYLPRVMEPLFTTKGNEGSGLGLSICKELIEIEHRGKFKIENHPQGGALVTIQIPKLQEK